VRPVNKVYYYVKAHATSRGGAPLSGGRGVSKVRLGGRLVFGRGMKGCVVGGGGAGLCGPFGFDARRMPGLVLLMA